MRIAQQLYEGVDIDGHGTIGIITYLRTDSTRVAAEADVSAREYIKNNYGVDYYCPIDNKKENDKKFRMRMKQSDLPISSLRLLRLRIHLHATSSVCTS